LRLFSFGGYGLALAALALVVFGAYDSYPESVAHSLTDPLSDAHSKGLKIRKKKTKKVLS